MKRLTTMQMIEGALTIINGRRDRQDEKYNGAIADITFGAQRMELSRIEDASRRASEAEALINEYDTIIELLNEIKETYEREAK